MKVSTRQTIMRSKVKSSTEVEISQKFPGLFGSLVLKSLRALNFFQGQIWFFLYLVYIRYTNEPTFSRTIWTLGFNIL